jgi:hypothetical protein
MGSGNYSLLSAVCVDIFPCGRTIYPWRTEGLCLDGVFARKLDCGRGRPNRFGQVIQF